MHGHTWRVEALWHFDGTDAVVRHKQLRDCLFWFDHITLPDDLAWAEDIAESIADTLGCFRVTVDRPEEGLFAIWEADR